MNSEDVQQVVAGCGCGEDRAHSLLKITGGNVAKAIDLGSVARNRRKSAPVVPEYPPSTKILDSGMSVPPKVPGAYPHPLAPDNTPRGMSSSFKEKVPLGPTAPTDYTETRGRRRTRNGHIHSAGPSQHLTTGSDSEHESWQTPNQPSEKLTETRHDLGQGIQKYSPVNGPPTPPDDERDLSGTLPFDPQKFSVAPPTSTIHLHKRPPNNETPGSHRDERVPLNSANVSLLRPTTSNGGESAAKGENNDGPEEQSGSRANQVPPQPRKVVKWNFILPTIEKPITFNPGGADGRQPFSVRELAGAIQHGATSIQVRSYLGHYDMQTVKSKVSKGVVENTPIMFYIVARNDASLIRTFAELGGDVNSIYEPYGVPLVAFAIAHSENIGTDTTLTLATLLSLGATADAIPKSFYSPFCVDLPDSGPDEAIMLDLSDANKAWCRPEFVRHKLARTMNLTQRYYLNKSMRMKKPSIRARQVAKIRSSEALLGVPYFLIGQTAAANLVINHLLCHMIQNPVRQTRPLVMVFAGPSGHGKTELARKLGHLLSLELQVVDCTSVSREADLFGPRAPFNGSAQGSPLNNFLTRKAGERCIVFLDEFEKTGAEIHNALLLPFDNGEYEDRRTRRTVDCSRTIWVLATNAMDERIVQFCNRNPAMISDDDGPSTRPALTKQLSGIIKDDFKRQFKPPLTGRISCFVPFIPFSPGERAVGAHKYLLELTREVSRPVHMQAGLHEQLFGDIHMTMRRDASVCRAIAHEGFDPDTGIRSMINAVRDLVRIPLMLKYLDAEALIEEGHEPMNYMLDMRNNEIAINAVGVSENGGRKDTAGKAEIDGELEEDYDDDDDDDDEEEADNDNDDGDDDNDLYQ